MKHSFLKTVHSSIVPVEKKTKNKKQNKTKADKRKNANALICAKLFLCDSPVSDRVGDWGESLDDVIRRQWRRREGGHIRWNTPQDKDSSSFLVAQLSEVNVRTGLLLNGCEHFSSRKYLTRHRRRGESAYSCHRTLWVRRFGNKLASISQSLNNFGIAIVL